MHFERLTISGFGPYAGTEMIDFDALAHKGLFSVTGDTGSGKTTIFDALTFALYGDLPGMRPAGTVRSEHAGPRQKCNVELVFRAATAKWKVVRTPKHERPKVRGDGFTEVKNQAALYRWDGSGWEPLTTTINEVTKQCAALVGLAQDQFERVGLLPQGEFKRLLVANSSERKKLFRTLFGTGSIEAGVRQLVEDAKAAEADAAAARSRLEEIEAEAAPLVDRLTEIASADTEGVVSLPAVDQGSADNGPAVVSLKEIANDIHRRVLPMLEGAEAASNGASRNASTILGSATEQAAQVAKRAVLRTERKELDAQRPRIEKGAAAAELARRAVPVVQAERNVARYRASLEQRTSIVTGARQKVERLARHHQVHYEPDQSSDELQRQVASLIPVVAEAARNAAERQELQKQSAAARGETAETIAALAACDEQAAAQQVERTDAVEMQAQAEAAVERVSVLAGELPSLEAAEEAARDRDTALANRKKLTAALDEAKAQLVEIDRDVAAGSAVIAELRETVDLLPNLTAAFAEAERCRTDAARLAQLNTKLAEAEMEFLAADMEHAAKARAFALGIAPRLARQLTDGEPCLVCGSTEHPAPAEGDEDVIDQEQMNEAHHYYNRAFANLTSVRDAVAQLAVQLGPTTDFDDANAAVVAAGTRLSDARAAQEQLVATTSRLDELMGSKQELTELTAGVITQIEGSEAALIRARNTLADDADTALTTLAQRAEAHRCALAQARAEADGLAGTRSRVKQADDHLALITTRRTELTAKLSADHATIDSLSAQISKLDDSLATWNDVDLFEREAGLELLATSISDLAERVDTANLDADRVRNACAERDAALSTAQLRSVQEALECELDGDEIQRLEDLHEVFKARSLDCDSQLRQLAELNVPENVPDLDELADAARDAQRIATEATGRRVGVQHLVEQALNLVTTWEERLAQVAALTDIADRKTQVARLCDAKGASRIGLEGFILRSHLHDVVVQANIRLDNLSNGRYQMVLAEEALNAQGEWGLDLTIIDAHTGTERPVTTLSGGETFYTSLSLALGLSDVLSNRGATSISSVFIDEGFGALDDNAIDDTIDVLNQLRSDGVTIGVITHVGALRDALPAGITVQKLPSGGSRLVQVA